VVAAAINEWERLFAELWREPRRCLKLVCDRRLCDPRDALGEYVALRDRNRPLSPTVDKPAILGSHPLFRELGSAIRAKLAERAKIRNVDSGAIIFSKGDAGTALFAVCSGTVEVIAPSIDGKSAVFNLITEGEIFGEIALLDGQPRTANAVAFTDCKLMVIERRDFLPLLRSQPDLTIRLVELLCSRLRRTTEQVEDLMFLDLRGRLVKTLLRLTEMAKPERRIAISQSDLSQIVGLSREMINRQLQIWAKNGWIKLERRGITVLAPGTLSRIIGKE
jgi:CRP-like cAMP-binding protein